MLILSVIQAILAMSFILFGLVVLFAIGITGLVFLVPGAILAATAGMAQESRVGTIVALALDAVLVYLAVRKLEALVTSETTDIRLHQTIGALGRPGPFDYLPPSAALVLIGVGALAVVADWRALRNSPWF
jgi:hypothetical protein